MAVVSGEITAFYLKNKHDAKYIFLSIDNRFNRL